MSDHHQDPVSYFVNSAFFPQKVGNAAEGWRHLYDYYETGSVRSFHLPAGNLFSSLFRSFFLCCCSLQEITGSISSHAHSERPR